MKYAARTTVGSDRSRSEIERTLTRYGASQFAYGWSGESAMIGFKFSSRLIRFVVDMPKASETRTATGRRPRNASKAHDQMTRQKWRALSLGIKAKLELVESGITTFEQEFLAQTVLPSGQTFGEWATPQLDAIYATGNIPPLLAAPTIVNEE